MAKNAPKKIPNEILAKLMEMKNSGAVGIELMAYVRSCNIDISMDGLMKAIRHGKERLQRPDASIIGNPTTASVFAGGSPTGDTTSAVSPEDDPLDDPDNEEDPTETTEAPPISALVRSRSRSRDAEDEELSDAEWTIQTGKRLKRIASRVLSMMDDALERGKDDRVSKLASSLKPVLEQARTAMAQARMAAPQGGGSGPVAETSFAAGIRAYLEQEERAKEAELAEISSADGAIS